MRFVFVCKTEKLKENPKAMQFCESWGDACGSLLISAESVRSLGFRSVSIIHKDVQAAEFKR